MANSQFTRQAILNTFTDMLEAMPMDKITITALSKKCGISANTFYYHFESMSDLLNHWFLEELGTYFALPPENWLDAVKKVCHHCKEHSARTYHIYNSLSKEQMELYIYRITDPLFTSLVEQYAAGKNYPDSLKKDVSEFCRFSLMGFFVRFIVTGMTADIDSDVERLHSLYTAFLSAVLK